MECHWKKETFSSKKLATPIKQKGQKGFDVNTRAIIYIYFREMCKGHSAIQSFCKCMNMPPPMSHPSFVHNEYTSCQLCQSS